MRLLAPFDPIVWDRRRFELLWGWAYRFEAYTPAAKRKLGYYALPLLWGDRIVGWGNATLREGALEVQTGFVGLPERSAVFRRAFSEETARMSEFLGLCPTETATAAAAALKRGRRPAVAPAARRR